MTQGDSLTATNILAAASDILTMGGYVRVSDEFIHEWPTTNARLFEDLYGIVAVVVYETWGDLSSGWVDVQDALVRIISGHVSSNEAKAWDGYLVLFTPGILGAAAHIEATEIRNDTLRVRKLVAGGDELKGLADVERVLLPLLPLATDFQIDEEESVLDILPDLLARRNIPRNAVRVLIDAFSEQQSLMEHLHAHRTQT
jgi:hypothetical protein